MKTNLVTKGLMVLALMTLVSLGGFAQRGQRWMDCDNSRIRHHGIPNLTEAQQSKIDALMVKHLKEVTPLRNELLEKEARLNTLESADKPDMNAINKTIDEIAALKAQIMKKRVAHRTEVATQLTDEQKVYFNANRHRMGKGDGFGNGKRRNRADGYGMGHNRNCMQRDW